MKAQKVMVTITIETLSTDSVRYMLYQAGDKIHSEALNGNLRMEDGDEVTWNTEIKSVEF